MSPADLHAFWRRTTESMQQTPIGATCTDAPTQGGREYVTSLVQLNSFEGKRLRAWYTVPIPPRPRTFSTSYLPMVCTWGPIPRGSMHGR